MERGEAAIGIQEDCQWDAARLQLRHRKIVNGVQRGCNGGTKRLSMECNEAAMEMRKDNHSDEEKQSLGFEK